MICAWCGQVFFLCRFCDDGDRYCRELCAEVARRESVRAAGRRYQQTAAGRAHHAARQQRCLDRREAAKMTHQTAQKLPEVVEVPTPDPVPMHDASTVTGEEPDHAFTVVAIDSKCDETRILATAGPRETVLKARLSATAQHPRAVPALLEALAMWEGMPVRAAIVADGKDGSSATRLRLDWLANFVGEPLYHLEFVPGHKRRHRDLLEGMGTFADLRQLVLFEEAR